MAKGHKVAPLTSPRLGNEPVSGMAALAERCGVCNGAVWLVPVWWSRLPRPLCLDRLQNKGLDLL